VARTSESADGLAGKDNALSLDLENPLDAANTGDISGKSSLLAALSRILDLQHGSIRIDGVDISSIPRQLLRSKVLNVPQEPFVNPGTIRDNIDPLRTLPDDDLVAILQDVCLWDTLEGGEQDAGDAANKLEIDAKKAAFSAGQLQLLSLARAMVQRGKIIVMDEVGSK
jgi:ATP-binding cassette, subfamily C (CFTR/MRP), member 1